MGLGKSLSTIALIEAVIRHKAIKTVLLVAPVNPIDHWVNEFDKWIGTSVDVHNFVDLSSKGPRCTLIRKWQSRGGVLLISSKALTSFLRQSQTKGGEDYREHIRQTDLLIIDEAHQFLKTKGTKCEIALKMIRTKRKIALSGTPLQNK